MKGHVRRTGPHGKSEKKLSATAKGKGEKMSYLIEATNGTPISLTDTFREVVDTVISVWPGVVWYDRLDRPVGPEGQPQGTLTAVVWVGSKEPKRTVVARSRLLTVS